MKTLLFADDNPLIREFCQRDLEDEGYRVLPAQDGWEAVRLVRKRAPDLVILDIAMPNGGGLDVIGPIKQIEPQTPVILFTSFDEDCMADPRSRLASECVEKSEDLTELKRAIVRLLAKRGRRNALRIGLCPEGPADEKPARPAPDQEGAT